MLSHSSSLVYFYRTRLSLHDRTDAKWFYNTIIYWPPPNERSEWRRYCFRRIVCLSEYVFACARIAYSESVNHAVGAWNANSFKTVKFDRPEVFSGLVGPLKFMENGVTRPQAINAYSFKAVNDTDCKFDAHMFLLIILLIKAKLQKFLFFKISLGIHILAFSRRPSSYLSKQMVKMWQCIA